VVQAGMKKGRRKETKKQSNTSSHSQAVVTQEKSQLQNTGDQSHRTTGLTKSLKTDCF